jgi:hypothetical protein
VKWSREKGKAEIGSKRVTKGKQVRKECERECGRGAMCNRKFQRERNDKLEVNSLRSPWKFHK